MASDLSPSLSNLELENEDESPWGDVPSRSHSSQNLPQTANEGSFGAQDAASKPPASPAPGTLSPAVKSPSGRGPRNRGRVSAQTTRLEAIDDSLGPLGPLGGGDDGLVPAQAELPPAPPSKEAPKRSAVPNSPTAPLRSQQGPAVYVEDDPTANLRPRPPPPVNLPHAPQSPRPTERSMSIEQAAKPSFEISVGDPHKVGDLTSSHIVYHVRTKTTSKAYKQPDFAVNRRYRDFLWLYNQLHNNNPGVVVPPPPEKQAVGRFDTGFVESRRAALERMLNKSAAHPILQHDGDLKLFLESDAFNVDVKHKERKEPGLGESKGMFSGFGLSVGSSGKFVEQDEWFHERRLYLDALENQLKALLKAIDTVVKQRKELAEAAGDFSASLHSLASVELSTSLSGPLDALSDLQLRIRELYDRQAQQDVLTLGITVDEYIRLIGSIKQAFSKRQQAFHAWHAAESEMLKRKATQDKLLRQGKSQQDRLNQLSADVADAERRVHQARLLFEDMGRLMRGELERFEREKVEDFKSGVETFLEGAVEAQKELIELWETYLMQLDAEEDEETFYRPVSQGVPAVPTAGTNETLESQDTASTAASTAVADEDD